MCSGLYGPTFRLSRLVPSSVVIAVRIGSIFIPSRTNDDVIIPRIGGIIKDVVWRVGTALIAQSTPHWITVVNNRGLLSEAYFCVLLIDDVIVDSFRGTLLRRGFLAIPAYNSGSAGWEAMGARGVMGRMKLKILCHIMFPIWYQISERRLERDRIRIGFQIYAFLLKWVRFVALNLESRHALVAFEIDPAGVYLS